MIQKAFKCCYPSQPLLKKVGKDGGYTESGVMGCRSELFMYVDLMGTLNTRFQFSKVGNIYQCGLCGVFYRVQNNKLYMLLKEHWCLVDVVKNIIHLHNGKTVKVTMEIPKEQEISEKEYIEREKLNRDKRIAERRQMTGKNFAGFNIKND